MRIFKYIFKMSMLNTLISFLVIIGLVWVSQSFRSIKFIFEKGGTIIDFFKLNNDDNKKTYKYPDNIVYPG